MATPSPARSRSQRSPRESPLTHSFLPAGDPPSERYDVIVIGSGPGGASLASRLAPTGRRILILERGGYLKREQANWDTAAVFSENRYKADERWLDKEGKAFRPMVVVLIARALNHHIRRKPDLLDSQKTVAMVTEMIHTASLVHDDV